MSDKLPMTDKEYTERFWLSIGKLAEHTDKLAKEVHDDHHLTRSLTTAIRLIFLVVVLQFAAIGLGFALASDVFEDGEKDRAQLLAVTMDTNSIVKIMESATVPTGCISVRQEAFRSEAVRAIINDARLLLGAPLKEPDPAVIKALETPCPGEMP